MDASQDTIGVRHARDVAQEWQYLAGDGQRTADGQLLTPDFGMVKRIIKNISNGKVLNVRKFRIVKRRNFDIWAIAIRSHL